MDPVTLGVVALMGAVATIGGMPYTGFAAT